MHSGGRTSHGRHWQHAYRVVSQECTTVKHWILAKHAPGQKYTAVSQQEDPVLPIQHQSLVLALRQTGPGRSLPQRHSKSQAIAQSPQFQQPQCPNPQPLSTPHHGHALDMGSTQQRMRCSHELLLKRTKDAYTNGKEIFCDHRGKMEISTCLSIITLNITGLDAVIKRHKVEDWIKRQQKS